MSGNSTGCEQLNVLVGCSSRYIMNRVGFWALRSRTHAGAVQPKEQSSSATRCEQYMRMQAAHHVHVIRVVGLCKAVHLQRCKERVYSFSTTRYITYEEWRC
jgi:hypothetical protein